MPIDVNRECGDGMREDEDGGSVKDNASALIDANREPGDGMREDGNGASVNDRAGDSDAVAETADGWVESS